MMRSARPLVLLLFACSAAFAGCSAAGARPALPALDDALTGRVHALELAQGRVGGAARAVLGEAFADARFVLLAEEHNNRDIPALTVALFRMLQEERGFQYLAVEQDPLALAQLSQEPRRGRAGAAAEFVGSHPQALPFVSDQELRMLDEIAALSRARHDPLWGVEQAYGASHYLEALLPLATQSLMQGEISDLLESARSVEQRRDGERSRRWLSRAPEAAALLDLAHRFGLREGSEAHGLIEALAVSRRIYQDFHRASAGEPTGLHSNWRREDWMKQRFSQAYRMARFLEDQPPGVLVKAGGWHIRRGLGPGHVFTLGNMIHELALFEGSSAVSIDLVAFVDPAELGNRPALARLADAAKASGCSGWCLLDLRPLRALMAAGAFVDELEADTWRAMHRQVFGYEFLLLMPGSGAGSWELTGMSP